MDSNYGLGRIADTMREAVKQYTLWQTEENEKKRKWQSEENQKQRDFEAAENAKYRVRKPRITGYPG